MMFGLGGASSGTASQPLQFFGKLGLATSLLALGIHVPRALGPETTLPGTIPVGMYALGMAAQLAAVVRVFLQRPAYGAAATCAIGLVALTAVGRASTPFGYPVFVVLFLSTSAFAIARADDHRPRTRTLGARHAFGALLVIAACAGTMWAAAVKLPPLHAAMMKSILRGFRDRTGFSDSMMLGDMRGMTQSNEVVLRVRGAGVDHLRGVVFRRYNHGYWDAVGDEDRKLLETDAPPTGADVAELEILSRSTLPVPLGAREPWSSTGVLDVDPRGVLHAVAQHRPKRIAFRTTSSDHGTVIGDVRDEPDAIDRTMLTPLADRLKEILARWGTTGKPKREILRIIEERLRSDYAYSLDFNRTRRLDPVVDFLEREKRGHCEYFASAAALLARASGIPARVVGGYVVRERSALGDYAIVRERDAHAWAEVWVGGAWQTLDATPGAIGAVPETPWLGSVVDYAQTSWEKVDDWLAERSQLELSGALVGLMFVLVFVRWWRSRAKKPSAVHTEAPLEAFADLARALERAGVPPRATSEPMESFARRVAGPTLEPAAASAARAAIADYAALRYGAPRDEAAVVDAMRAARSLVEQRRASGREVLPRP